jgi:hypothetical protein
MYRQSQRNLSQAEIWYVLCFGRRLYNAGVLMVFLGKRDIPVGDRRIQRIAQLEGTAVLIDRKSGLILTIYRNKAAYNEHRKKQKRNWHKFVA